ncbi:hypothetical protein RHGRI_009749 [Rhododendron griersonianum]|uniref:Myb-like domain-containing protein n=1 Tax=Rhododendron griersonianum TaxID=479676 RepID=A0AAV6KFW8_9ERIC|nr:hypothetical protein RHGRI_009749 [Rhododendron griersonianum]
MKKKNVGGGRARLSKLHPQPSAMALSYLCQPTDSEAQPDSGPGGTRVDEASNDGQCGTVAETSTDSDHNSRCHELAPNTTDEMVVLAEHCGLEPQDICGPEECLEMDWTEAEVCIKCDKGGKLLVCSDSNCPLAVHEECMHCSARFDSMGNFYCPYCSYKRAMLETRKARKKAMLAKKALSVFLDKGMMNGDPQKQTAERDWRKEVKASKTVGDTKADNRSRLDGVEADYHFVQIEEDQREETFDVYKGAKASAVNEENDVVNRCSHSARPGDGAQHKVVIEEHMQQGPIIACGGDGTCCTEEETRHQFEIVQVDKSAQAEHPKLVDDHQNERLFQDKQQPDPLGATPVEKETELGSAIHISRELDNADVVKEHEGSRPEAEAMQDQEKGDTLSSSGDDFMQQDPAEDSDISHGDNAYVTYVSPHQRRIKKKNPNGIQSPSVDSPRKSARKLTKSHANVVHKEKKNATPKSRLTSPTLPHARRKKLPWTADEEEMLKEGVQKFSTMVNKNLPWRKILEFGRHVFDGTRTPADLKDKWRNILVKECSTK